MQRLEATIAGAHVRAQGVTVRSGGRPILRGVDLRARPGQTVGILGPSGSGKSTLLNALSGALDPNRGRVLIDGQEVHRALRADGSAIGYVPQEDIVHQHLSVARALMYAAQLRLPPEWDEGRLRAHVDGVLKLLELSPRARAKVRTLSAGERKRANIGVELVGRPRLLLLDEPAAGLDPALERKLMLLLRKLADDGRTVVLSTHVMGSLDVLDSMVVLSGGVVAFDGPPLEALRFFRVSHAAGMYDRLRGASGMVWRRQKRLGSQISSPRHTGPHTAKVC